MESVPGSPLPIQLPRRCGVHALSHRGAPTKDRITARSAPGEKSRFASTSASGRFATVGRRRRLWLPSTEKEPVMDQLNVVTKPREPWNKGKLVGQKTPFKLKEIWAIRIRLQLANCARDLALFDLAIPAAYGTHTLR